MKRTHKPYRALQIIARAALWTVVATVPILATTSARAQDRDDATHRARQHTTTSITGTGTHHSTSSQGTYSSHRTYSSGSANSHGRRGSTRASSTGLSHGLHRGWYKSSTGNRYTTRYGNHYTTHYSSRNSRYRRSTGTTHYTHRERDDSRTGARRHDTIDSPFKRHRD